MVIERVIEAAVVLLLVAGAGYAKAIMDTLSFLRRFEKGWFSIRYKWKEGLPQWKVQLYQPFADLWHVMSYSRSILLCGLAGYACHSWVVFGLALVIYPVMFNLEWKDPHERKGKVS
ncbi:hypothetical protein KQI63_15710 [bacterium]|nr:hypothetical protein [bacterium]